MSSWLIIMIKSSTTRFSAKATFVLATIFTLVIFQCSKRFWITVETETNLTRIWSLSFRIELSI